MIIIGEKINGAIPSIKQAIAERNEALIIERTLAQAAAGANFLDCAPSTATEIEYDTMVWLIGRIDAQRHIGTALHQIDQPNHSIIFNFCSGAGRAVQKIGAGFCLGQSPFHDQRFIFLCDGLLDRRDRAVDLFTNYNHTFTS